MNESLTLRATTDAPTGIHPRSPRVPGGTADICPAFGPYRDSAAGPDKIPGHSSK